MTTTVKVLIEGNKECEVKVINEDGSDSTGYPPRNIKPNTFTTIAIHGEQTVSVKEIGGFI
jgi:hypothetical protein